jgi:hypothetical protein
MMTKNEVEEEEGEEEETGPLFTRKIFLAQGANFSTDRSE